MRILLAVMLVAAAGWSAYWFAGARLAERYVSDWLEGGPAGGLVAGHESIAVRGYPFRFEINVEDPSLRDLWSGTGWSAPLIRLEAPGYRLTRLAAELPEGASLEHPEGGLSISAGAPAPRATLVLNGLQGFALQDATVSGDALALSTAGGAQTRLDRLRLSLREVERGAAQYRLSLVAEGFAPDSAWLAAEPFRAPPPEVFEAIALDVVLTLDALLDRAALSAPIPPRLRKLTLDEARITWGSTQLEVSGELIVGQSGRPEGVIDISAQDWRRLLDAAAALGFVHPEVARTWERALELLEEEGGTPGQLDVPLRFGEGRMRLGPLPIGPAPRLPGTRR